MFFRSPSKLARAVDLLLLLLTLSWILFIFSNSLRSGSASGQQSKSLLLFLQNVLRSLGIRGEISEYFLRKLAHFGEFAILGLLVCLDLWRGRILSLADPLRRALPLAFLSVPFCFCVAGIDEFLQRFSQGRAPLFSDVMIDTLGALCAFLCFSVFFSLLHQKKKRSSRSSEN